MLSTEEEHEFEATLLARSISRQIARSMRWAGAWMSPENSRPVKIVVSG